MLKMMAIIQFTLGCAFIFCVVVGYFEAVDIGGKEDVKWWSLCIVLVFLLGSITYYFGRGNNTRFYRREALLIVGMGWIVASIIGALPYYLILEDCSFVDALFESVSGLTTTGASVFSNLEEMDYGLMLWRCLSQWIGGLGIIVFFVAILSSLGPGAKILYDREASASSADFHDSGIQSGVKKVMILYMALTVLCGIAYLVAGMHWFDAICHAMTTLSTGGFSPHSESIAYFQSPMIEWICIVFMALGGTSFLYMLKLVNSKGRGFANEEVFTYYTIIIITALVIALSIVDPALGWHQFIRDSLFQVVSIITTTGFATANYDNWPVVTHMFLLGLMLIGGCSGSTAGGTKVIRFLIAFKNIRLDLIKAFDPRLVLNLKINGKVINESLISANTQFVLLVALCSLVSLPILAMLEPQISILGITSAYLATTFNIGPGLAEVGPTENFEQFSATTKLILSYLMLLGRLEFYALLTLFMPRFWKDI